MNIPRSVTVSKKLLQIVAHSTPSSYIYLNVIAFDATISLRLSQPFITFKCKIDIF